MKGGDQGADRGGYVTGYEFFTYTPQKDWIRNKKAATNMFMQEKEDKIFVAAF